MRTNLRILIVGYLVLLFLLVGVGSAATVRGQLVYANNAPAAFVAVRLSAPGRGASEFAYSGSDGKYYLRNIPAGTYQLEVWRGGKVAVTVAVTVQDPDTLLAATRLP
jgi:hypothetical protein